MQTFELNCTWRVWDFTQVFLCGNSWGAALPDVVTFTTTGKTICVCDCVWIWSTQGLFRFQCFECTNIGSNIHYRQTNRQEKYLSQFKYFIPLCCHLLIHFIGLKVTGSNQTTSLQLCGSFYYNSKHRSVLFLSYALNYNRSTFYK